MPRQYENYLFPNRKIKKAILFCFSIVSIYLRSQSVGNYVINGSFEDYFTANMATYVPYYWSALDSSKAFGLLLTTPSKVPNSSFTFQYPYEGKNYFITTVYSNFPSSINRSYPRNRLRTYLTSGKTYCVKVHVNLTNQSTHGIDRLGFYFGDSFLDTITKCTDPITYLIPQVENSIHNIITDTLNWVPITGTFVANGTEKYLVFGNFKSNANTDTVITNPTHLPSNFSDYLIDAVSVIEMNLPAYAGHDTTVTPGTPVFIGREPDFSIDPGCTWYKWPDMINPIYDKAGLWVNPVVTTTYIVKQVLDCSPEKWDTVVVTVDPTVGLSNFKSDRETLEMFPNPANEFVQFRFRVPPTSRSWHLIIFSSIGGVVKEEDLIFKEQEVKINTSELAKGVYIVTITDQNHAQTIRKLLISK